MTLRIAAFHQVNYLGKLSAAREAVISFLLAIIQWIKFKKGYYMDHDSNFNKNTYD
jgi:hypothetical protein